MNSILVKNKKTRLKMYGPRYGFKYLKTRMALRKVVRVIFIFSSLLFPLRFAMAQNNSYLFSGDALKIKKAA
jgi:hypothetical protein